jgi:hypothetical protein
MVKTTKSKTKQGIQQGENNPAERKLNIEIKQKKIQLIKENKIQ